MAFWNGTMSPLKNHEKLGRDHGGNSKKKTPHRLSERGFKLAPQAGLEPATQWLTATCSTN